MSWDKILWSCHLPHNNNSPLGWSASFWPFNHSGHHGDASLRLSGSSSSLIGICLYESLLLIYPQVLAQDIGYRGVCPGANPAHVLDGNPHHLRCSFFRRRSGDGLQTSIFSLCAGGANARVVHDSDMSFLFSSGPDRPYSLKARVARGVPSCRDTRKRCWNRRLAVLPGRGQGSSQSSGSSAEPRPKRRQARGPQLLSRCLES